MALIPNNRVLVASLVGEPTEALLRITLRRAWLLLKISCVLPALREILRLRPDVVIVQVTLQLGDDLELIRLLPSRMTRVSLIAVASSHHERIELAVRAAGVSGYLPAAADTELIEQTVADVLARRAAPASLPPHPAGTVTEHSTASFSSFDASERSGRRARTSRRRARGPGARGGGLVA